MRAIVLGGFEPSGHDAASMALLEAGLSRGHSVAMFNWRDVVPCAAHPLFHVHRVAVEMSAPSVAGLLDDPRITDALCGDLAGLVPLDLDCCISTHPWSTVIAATAFEASGASTLLIDSHGEFTPGPLHVTCRDRVDLFVGMTAAAAHPTRVLNRTRLTGVPVRAAFALPPNGARARSGVTLNAGTEHWALNTSLTLTESVLKSSSVRQLFVIGPRSEQIDRWAATCDVKVAYRDTGNEIADALRSSKLVITKASGSMVAEAVACEAIPLYVRSGVFWEDDARAALSASGVGLTGSDLCRLALVDYEACQRLGGSCRGAGNSIWAEIECLAERRPRTRSPLSSALADTLLAPLDDFADSDLAATSTAFAEVTRDWLR